MPDLYLLGPGFRRGDAYKQTRPSQPPCRRRPEFNDPASYRRKPEFNDPASYRRKPVSSKTEKCLICTCWPRLSPGRRVAEMRGDDAWRRRAAEMRAMQTSKLDPTLSFAAIAGESCPPTPTRGTTREVYALAQFLVFLRTR